MIGTNTSRTLEEINKIRERGGKPQYYWLCRWRPEFSTITHSYIGSQYRLTNVEDVKTQKGNPIKNRSTIVVFLMLYFPKLSRSQEKDGEN